VSTLVLLEAAREARGPPRSLLLLGGAGYGEQEYFPAGRKAPLRPRFPLRGGEGLRGALISITTVSSTAGIHGIAVLERVRASTGPPRGGGRGRHLLRAAPEGADRPRQRRRITDPRLRCTWGMSCAPNLAALSRGDGLSINIGTGIETDVNTLFRTLRDLAVEPPARRIHGPPMPGEQRRSVIENGMAFNELGWLS